MAMSLIKISRYVLKQSYKIAAPRYMSGKSDDSSGDDKDKKGQSYKTNNYKDLSDLHIPLYCAVDADNPSAPTMYDCRKYGHNLPCNNVAPNFETLLYIPTGIFRCTFGEVLGRGANKCGYYQNPEYFSYHHMTFFDMHLILRPCRQPSPSTGRKP